MLILLVATGRCRSADLAVAGVVASWARPRDHVQGPCPATLASPKPPSRRQADSRYPARQLSPQLLFSKASPKPLSSKASHGCTADVRLWMHLIVLFLWWFVTPHARAAWFLCLPAGRRPWSAQFSRHQHRHVSREEAGRLIKLPCMDGPSMKQIFRVAW